MSKFTQLSPDSNPGPRVTMSWASGPCATLLASSRWPWASQKPVGVRGATLSSWWWKDDRSQHPQERDLPPAPRSQKAPRAGPGDLSVGELGQVGGKVGIGQGRSTDLGVEPSWGSKPRHLYARTSGEGTSSFQFLTFTVTFLHLPPKCSFYLCGHRDSPGRGCEGGLMADNK